MKLTELIKEEKNMSVDDVFDIHLGQRFPKRSQLKKNIEQFLSKVPSAKITGVAPTRTGGVIIVRFNNNVKMEIAHSKSLPVIVFVGIKDPDLDDQTLGMSSFTNKDYIEIKGTDNKAFKKALEVIKKYNL